MDSSTQSELPGFLRVPKEVRQMICRLLLLPPTFDEIPLCRESKIRDELPLHHTVRTRRSQIIYPAIFRVNKKIHREAIDVLHFEAVICLSPKDLVCLDNVTAYETLRQVLRNNAQKLQHHRRMLVPMRGLIDPHVFKHFVEVYIELHYINFGCLCCPRLESYSLRLGELESDHDITELRDPVKEAFFRTKNAFEILVRTISRQPYLKSLFLDVSVLQHAVARNRNFQRYHRNTLIDFTKAFGPLEVLGKLSYVQNFDMKLYSWAGRNGCPWDGHRSVVELEQIDAEAVQRLKDKIEANFERGGTIEIAEKADELHAGSIECSDHGSGNSSTSNCYIVGSNVDSRI
ncbi:hypothetical protein DL95DRAFT_416554 [Leptodontidium sp. 2 PMI_412]|nr:hypothetical protein DL95DRAFT_416554 [Leptodontidium sp. 2 PMI_412]